MVIDKRKRRGKDSPFFKGYGEIPMDVFSIIRRGAKGGGKFKSCHLAICVPNIPISPEYELPLSNRLCSTHSAQFDSMTFLV